MLMLHFHSAFVMENSFRFISTRTSECKSIKFSHNITITKVQTQISSSISQTNNVQSVKKKSSSETSIKAAWFDNSHYSETLSYMWYIYIYFYKMLNLVFFKEIMRKKFFDRMDAYEKEDRLLLLSRVQNIGQYVLENSS